MQSIDYTENLATTQPHNPKGQLRHWAPVLIPVIAIALAILFGMPDKASDDIGWLNRLAKAGDSGAQLQVGLAYRDGRYGLTADATKGFYWLQQAANNGNAYAEDTVAEMYASGTGTPQDITLAMQWWTKSMHDGDPQARLHMSEALIKSGKIQEAEGLLHRDHTDLKLQYN